MLRNPSITGRRKDASGKTVLRVPPLVSVQDFNAIQAKLDNRAYRKGVRTRKDTALLTSVLACHTCGAPIYRIKTRQGEFYYCRSGQGCKVLLAMATVDSKAVAGIMPTRENRSWSTGQARRCKRL